VYIYSYCDYIQIGLFGKPCVPAVLTAPAAPAGASPQPSRGSLASAHPPRHSHCTRPLRIPTANAHCAYPLRMPTAHTHCECSLPIPTAHTHCACRLRMPNAHAHCARSLRMATAHVYCARPLRTRPARMPIARGLPLPPLRRTRVRGSSRRMRHVHCSAAHAGKRRAANCVQSPFSKRRDARVASVVQRCREAKTFALSQLHSRGKFGAVARGEDGGTCPPESHRL
jgi:hypothetical protein